MQTLRNIAFGMGHGLLLTAMLFLTVGGSLKLVMLLAPTLKTMPVPPLVQLLLATAIMIGIIFVVAWKVIYPYTEWLEPRLKKIF